MRGVLLIHLFRRHGFDVRVFDGQTPDIEVIADTDDDVRDEAPVDPDC